MSLDKFVDLIYSIIGKYLVAAKNDGTDGSLIFRIFFKVFLNLFDKFRRNLSQIFKNCVQVFLVLLSLLEDVLSCLLKNCDGGSEGLNWCFERFI